MAQDACIETGKSGILDDMTEADAARVVQTACKASHVVLHLHGGLVSKQTALAKAKELAPFYRANAKAEPIFAIYQTGMGEILGQYLPRIAEETIFSILREKVLKWTIGMCDRKPGARFIGPDLPSDLAVKTELQRMDGEPFDRFEASSPPELSEEDERKFEAELEGDDELRAEVEAIAGDGAEGSRGAIGLRGAPKPTLISPEIIDELEEEKATPGARGFGMSAKFLWRAVKILKRTLSRLRSKRDHGVYCTVVEEILRELYFTNVGAGIWRAMKDQAAYCFAAEPGLHGGTLLIKHLSREFAQGRRPKVSIVAHSMGSVYAKHFLLAWQEATARGQLPADARISNLIFLAPAIDIGSFAELVRKTGAVFDTFRMITLSDKAEAGYWEVPVLYPRSLLYLVSGVVEREDNGLGAFDRPIAGMARYFELGDVYKSVDELESRNYLGVTDRILWSPDGLETGSRTDAMKHGEFDDLQPRGGAMRTVANWLR